LVQDLFGQGADQGLAPEGTAVVLFGALDNVVNMEGAFGGDEYVMDEIHVRLPARLGRAAFLGTAQRAQGAELGEGGVFQDIEEVGLGERVHGEKKQVVMNPNLWYE